MELASLITHLVDHEAHIVSVVARVPLGRSVRRARHVHERRKRKAVHDDRSAQRVRELGKLHVARQLPALCITAVGRSAATGV